MQNIVVIDYGMGNLRSVAKALEKVASPEQKVIVTRNKQDIQRADRIVFPGQGAGKACMQALIEYDLVDLIKAACASKPVLGICMGLQVLMNATQENGGVTCLSLFDGEVQSFKQTFEGLEGDTASLKIPHMGWNQVAQAQRHLLWKNIPDKSHFYFVHSYYLQVHNREIVQGTTQYGIEYVSAIGRDNVFAVQFHPEKSAKNGLQLLANFLTWSL